MNVADWCTAAKPVGSRPKRCRKLGDNVCLMSVEPAANDTPTWAIQSLVIAALGKKHERRGAVTGRRRSLLLAYTLQPVSVFLMS